MSTLPEYAYVLIAIAVIGGVGFLANKFRQRTKSQRVEDKPWTGPTYGGSDSKPKQ